MKALRLHGSVAHPVFVYEDAPKPEPAAGEVLVRVQAAAVTPTEIEWVPTWTTRSGSTRPMPIILGHEFSGEVSGVGPGVDDVTNGDLVFGMNDWFGEGAQAEYCVAHVDEVALKPRSIDHVSAAATPISALTAWQGLFDRARLTAGQSVLIHGAAGGVGIFAVQLARWRGARVIGTASGASLDLVRDLGADESIDYRRQRFEEVVQNLDVVFDAVGGETLDRSWSVLKPGGRLVTIAVASERSETQRVRDAFFIVEPNRAQLTEIAGLIDTGTIRIVVGAVFPLSRGSSAYQHKPPHGKVIVRADE